jgi:hypothetical protein
VTSFRAQTVTAVPGQPGALPLLSTVESSGLTRLEWTARDRQRGKAGTEPGFHPLTWSL